MSGFESAVGRVTAPPTVIKPKDEFFCRYYHADTLTEADVTFVYQVADRKRPRLASVVLLKSETTKKINDKSTLPEYDEI